MHLPTVPYQDISVTVATVAVEEVTSHQNIRDITTDATKAVAPIQNITLTAIFDTSAEMNQKGYNTILLYFAIGEGAVIFICLMIILIMITVLVLRYCTRKRTGKCIL